MSYPINYPTPQGANIQIFKEGGTTSDWIKPQGASFVWFTLIGAGGGGALGENGGSGGGGGSGAVTNFMCPAFLIPDVLNIKVARGSTYPNTAEQTSVIYQQKNGTGYTLLTAYGGSSGGYFPNGGNGGAGGLPMNDGPFTAMGFLNSNAGADGSLTGTDNGISAYTFLTGGGSNYIFNGAYGYSSGDPNQGGYFQMQPIIVGVGAPINYAGIPIPSNAAIGCGGGGGGVGNTGSSYGGSGMVVIITW